MARDTWKRYYGIVIEVPQLGRVFANGIMYADRDEAHKQAARMRKPGRSYGAFAIGVVGVRGKTPDVQRSLYKRATMGKGFA